MSMRLFTIPLLCLLLSTLAALPASASENDGYIDMCLKAWGKHPFGTSPQYKTLAASVKIFGIGQDMEDLLPTKAPELVLVDTGVNIMGGSTMQLLNPNGYYCFRSNVNVMGGLTIKAHCKAHLASASDGLTVLGADSANKSVTVMGATRIQLVGCDK
jgi:hypothetical protein